MRTKTKKRWFTQKVNVDIETGEVLSDSRIERERYVYKRSSYTTEDCGAYYLKKVTKEYESNKQTRLDL
mgnify:CR=1 FL=1